jgi:hypothetical protein
MINNWDERRSIIDVSEMSEEKLSTVVLGRIHISAWVRETLEERLKELVTRQTCNVG